MHLHEFGLLVIILLLLVSIIILCAICSFKVYNVLYGTFEKDYDLPMKVSSLSFNHSIDPRTIQTRIKCFRKPYRKMKETHSKNMPPIIEVNTPVDSDAKGDLEESVERVSVCSEKGVSNYWKRETIILM